jgi:hypothetical protein
MDGENRSKEKIQRFERKKREGRKKIERRNNSEIRASWKVDRNHIILNGPRDAVAELFQLIQEYIQKE